MEEHLVSGEKLSGYCILAGKGVHMGYELLYWVVCRKGKQTSRWFVALQKKKEKMLLAEKDKGEEQCMLMVHYLPKRLRSR